MGRKPRSATERTFHRVQIAFWDLEDAARFAKAAQEAEASGADPVKDVTHRALMCAAVIYYARPFVPNEHRNPKKRHADAADTAVDVGPLNRWIPDPARRKLHRQLIRLRNKIVAHAESRYFDAKLFRSPETMPHDYGVLNRRTYARFDLEAMRLNTVGLRKALVWMQSALGPDVRRGKRLRTLPLRPAMSRGRVASGRRPAGPRRAA